MISHEHIELVSDMSFKCDVCKKEVKIEYLHSLPKGWMILCRNVGGNLSYSHGPGQCKNPYCGGSHYISWKVGGGVTFCSLECWDRWPRKLIEEGYL